MYSLLILSIFLMNSSQVSAEFDLFNQDRGKPPDPPPPAPLPAPPPPPAPKPPPPPQKDFVLKGTTKFGNTYRVFLQTPDGKDLAQDWSTDLQKNREIEGFSDFSIVAVKPREVVIRYPDNSPCINSHLDRGIHCSADHKTATLKIVRGAPTPPKPVVQLPSAVPTSPPPPPGGAGGGLVPANSTAPSPEAQRLQALFQQAAQQNQAQNASAKTGDSPPAGMRVIKTPFGDRLVPETKQ